MSPHFVAVAQHKDKQEVAAGRRREKPICWLHALGEDTCLPAVSFDVVSLAYVVRGRTHFVRQSVIMLRLLLRFS